MKEVPYLVALYGIVLFIGGLIGFFKAGSLISLVAAACFSILFLQTARGIMKNNLTSFYVALTALFALLLFFGYRYFTSYKMMPAGAMSIMTFILICYLILRKN